MPGASRTEQLLQHVMIPKTTTETDALTGSNFYRQVVDLCNINYLKVTTLEADSAVVATTESGTEDGTLFYGLKSNPTSNSNTLLGAVQGIGVYSGFRNTNTFSNLYVGYRAGCNSTNVSNSIFLGMEAGRATTNVSGSVYIGNQAGATLADLSGKNFNVAIGYRSASNSVGATNVFLGAYAGQSVKGNGNVLLGYQAASTTGPESNWDGRFLVTNTSNLAQGLLYGIFPTAVGNTNQGAYLGIGKQPVVSSGAHLDVAGDGQFNGRLSLSGDSYNADLVTRNTLLIQRGGVSISRGFLQVNLSGGVPLYDLDVSGTVGFRNTLTVSGTTLLGSNLGVQGALNLSGAAQMASNVSIAGTLGVSGQAQFAGAMGVSGAAVFGSNVGVAGALNVSGAALLASNLSVAGSLGVSGQAQFAGAMGVSGAAVFGSNLGVQGAFNLSGAASLASTLGVSGQAQFGAAMGVSGAAVFGSNVGIAGALNLSGAALMSSNLSVLGALGVSGASVFSNSVGMTQGLNVSGAVMFWSNLGVSGDLNVSGSIITPSNGTTNIANVSFSNGNISNASASSNWIGGNLLSNGTISNSLTGSNRVGGVILSNYWLDWGAGLGFLRTFSQGGGSNGGVVHVANGAQFTGSLYGSYDSSSAGALVLRTSNAAVNTIVADGKDGTITTTGRLRTSADIQTTAGIFYGDGSGLTNLPAPSGGNNGTYGGVALSNSSVQAPAGVRSGSYYAEVGVGNQVRFSGFGLWMFTAFGPSSGRWSTTFRLFTKLAAQDVTSTGNDPGWTFVYVNDYVYDVRIDGTTEGGAGYLISYTRLCYA